MKKRLVCGVGVALFLVATMGAPASAQVCGPLDDGRLAEVAYSSTALFWSPVIQYREMVLTISGPCETIVRRFGPNDEISFDIREIERVTDGQYHWSLRRVIADPELEAELASLRGSGKEDDIWWNYFQQGKIPAGPYVDSGNFGVVEGQVIDPNKGEEPQGKRAGVARGGAGAQLAGAAFAAAGDAQGAPGGGNTLGTKDFVINDDLIVDGSACIGFDCVNGEVFSFDTIRLKENNLRIKFDDTSVVPSFPANDWQITANESANGGASKFSIEDVSGSRTPFTIEANARSHSLYIDDGGRLGLRTSTPSVEIHTIDGDTPTLRLQQDGSSGFEPQTWDVAGNETNFFIRDVTNGSTLPFRIRPSAPSNSIFIDVDGDVGMGTSSPSEALHVRGTDGSTKLLVEEASGTTNGRQVMELRNNGNVNFILVNSAASGEDWQLLAESTGGFPGFSISRQGSGVREFYMDDSGNLEITGEITTSGSCSIGCDLVFDPDYELPSIEDHAAEMFANRHLPAVGPTPEEGPFNLSQKVGGMLNELEKAHIYIAQLSDEKKALETEQDSLRAEVAELRALVEALADVRE